MNDENRWDRDPSPDRPLARMLRDGGADVPYKGVDWEGLCRRVMDRVGLESKRKSDWMDVLARWGGPAMAASLLAMLFSGLLFLKVFTRSPEPEIASAAPEFSAVARAASAYPDEPTFVSLVRNEHRDEFTAWGAR
jgi:hypothetical protein